MGRGGEGKESRQDNIKRSFKLGQFLKQGISDLCSRNWSSRLKCPCYLGHC